MTLQSLTIVLVEDDEGHAELIIFSNALHELGVFFQYNRVPHEAN